jgi:hypothetical protein
VSIVAFQITAYLSRVFYAAASWSSSELLEFALRSPLAEAHLHHQQGLLLEVCDVLVAIYLEMDTGAS